MMFRITKVFENPVTFLYRIEGKVTESTLKEWGQELRVLNITDGKQVILDFAQVYFITPKAVEILLSSMTENLFILNCGMEIRNRFHSSGLSARMLE